MPATPLDHAAILRTILGLGADDMLVTMLVDDQWRLAVIWAARPVDERVQILDQFVDGIEYGTQAKAGEVLRELAVHAALDAGWVIEKITHSA